MSVKSLLVLMAVAVVSSCATAPAGRVSVPAVPGWIAPADARAYDAVEVTVECQRLAPGAQVVTTDAAFTPLAHDWLVAAVHWAWEFGKSTGLGFTPESFDCDKFAVGFAFAANVAASRAGVKAQPLLARIHVMQRVPFGGVPAGGGHALNAFLSDRGIFVLEPQASPHRRLVPLAEYPNREQIFRILIGG